MNASMSDVAAFASGEIFAAVQGKIGLVHVDVAGRPAPLWLRAGTDDAAECVKMSSGLPGGLRIPYAARRILEIGAGAGYRSVALAVAFADAEIVSIEADPAYRVVNLLNTLPYRNVTTVFGAVSDAAKNFGFHGRGGGGSHVVLAAGGDVSAMPLAQVLAAQKWDSFDTVIIRPDAASASLLAGAWPKFVRLIAVFTWGQKLAPEIAAHFSDEEFLSRQEGQYVLLYRREVAVAAVAALPAPVFDVTGPAGEFGLVNVSPQPWGFFPIGARGFRLHPNDAGAPAARLILAGRCRGFSQFRARLRVGHASAAPVQFTVTITAEPQGTKIFSASETVPGGTEQVMSGEMTPHGGECRVVFAVKMAAAGAKNNAAWAEILDSAFI